MALTDEGSGNGFYMPVAPAGNNGFGFGGGDWAWILLLLLIGGNGWGFGGFGGGAMMGMDYGLYPWLNNSQHISDGFRDQQMTTYLNSLQNSVTSGFGDVQNALCAGFNQAEISANARQMSNMQSLFGVQSALQNCCCENRAGLADLKYTVATENCADRAAVSDGIRDILAATQAQTQAILDKMCQDKIDEKNDTIAQLRQELLFARGKDSQDIQTADIINGTYNRFAQCPVGTTPVYGNQPIFTCGNGGCGCGA